MKRVLKFLFAAVVLFTLANVNYPDAVTAYTCISTGVAVLTAFIVPPQYWLSSNLNIGGLDLEVWKKYIIEKFRKDNAFMFKSKDDSGFVLGGAVVHIPQAGADPAIVKNRTVYPATASTIGDTDLTYTLDTYSSDPTHIPWDSIQTLSYNKIDSILGRQTRKMGETIADDMLIKWSPAVAQFVLTTGGPGALTDAPVSGQTGTRKQLNSKDLIKAFVAMNITNTPKAGRVCLIDDNMFGGLYDSLTDSQMNSFNQFADNANGVLGRLHGFDIMTRSSVLAYASGNTVKALGSALAATDNLASLCWHPDTVCKAVGTMKPFQQIDNPLYYGDIYSAMVRMGGRKERADNLGVLAIVQAP
jgi:hypothetical protein